jgi:putative SOS response-associated peptidase YedK
MCGRFVVAGASAELVALFDVDLPADDLPAPSWNIAPTDRVPVILDSIPKDAEVPEEAEPVRRLESARWGLVPSWAKDLTVGGRAFNARIETVGDNAMFKTAVRKRRAIVPATGYYEWKTIDGVKHPHFIHLPDELTVFAGLYEWWRNPEAADDSPDKWLLSTSVITRSSTGPLADIHDRMPVFLSPELIEEWLDPHAEFSAVYQLDELLEAIAEGGAETAERMELYEVGREVGNVKNNGPQLLEPVG